MSETGHLAPSQLLDPYSKGIASGTQNIFQTYLGPPPRHETNAAEKRNVTIWNLAEAYEGRSLFIKDTIEDWLWTADQTYYTEVCIFVFFTAVKNVKANVNFSGHFALGCCG